MEHRPLSLLPLQPRVSRQDSVVISTNSSPPRSVRASVRSLLCHLDPRDVALPGRHTIYFDDVAAAFPLYITGPHIFTSGSNLAVQNFVFDPANASAFHNALQEFFEQQNIPIRLKTAVLLCRTERVFQVSGIETVQGMTAPEILNRAYRNSGHGPEHFYARGPSGGFEDGLLWWNTDHYVLQNSLGVLFRSQPLDAAFATHDPASHVFTAETDSTGAPVATGIVTVSDEGPYTGAVSLGENRITDWSGVISIEFHTLTGAPENLNDYFALTSAPVPGVALGRFSSPVTLENRLQQGQSSLLALEQYAVDYGAGIAGFEAQIDGSGTSNLTLDNWDDNCLMHQVFENGVLVEASRITVVPRSQSAAPRLEIANLAAGAKVRAFLLLKPQGLSPYYNF